MSSGWTGIVSTIVGSSEGFKDGNVNEALLNKPIDITISCDGTLYVADIQNHRIRKISSDGVVSTIAGSKPGFEDGNTNSALFNYPSGITISNDNTLYVADTGNNRIRKISTNGIVSTVGYCQNEHELLLFYPFGVAVSRDGTLYVADSGNNQIRKISTNGIVSTIAGSMQGFKDGNANDSEFNYPCGIAISCNGTLYVADSHNNRIRKISSNGIVSTITGSTMGFKDGNTNSALFNYPKGIAISNDNTLYVADTYNHRIRKISTNGIVSTIAGSTEGFMDGNARNSLFNLPYEIAISSDGTLYVSDTYNHRIRKILPDMQYLPIKLLLYDNNYCDINNVAS